MSPSPAFPHVPLAEVIRGGVVESVHYGAVAVVDRNGRLLHAAGDPHVLTFTRSALKPLQALPFVAGGGLDRFGFSKAQTALLCASHSGEPRHVEAVADMLARAGLEGTHLQCGTHAPGFYEARGEIPPPPPYSPLQHNCSGKHSGMLAYCVQCGHAIDDYLACDHPLQVAIRRAVATFTGVAEERLVAGTDGCSAPNYAVPLSGLARAFARLACAHRRSGLRACPPRARRRDDGPSGNGLRRAAQRPGAHAGRPRRLAHQDRRRRRAGDRHPQRGDRDRGQGRGRVRKGGFTRRPSRCWISSGSSTPRRAVR
jgi:L-asparaginase II